LRHRVTWLKQESSQITEVCHYLVLALGWRAAAKREWPGSRDTFWNFWSWSYLCKMGVRHV